MDDIDIIISIREYFDRQPKAQSLTVDYAKVDEEMSLPEGSTAKHLEAAAKDHSFEVEQKGTTKARLKKRQILPYV
jgi:hypothetical protein